MRLYLFLSIEGGTLVGPTIFFFFFFVDKVKDGFVCTKGVFLKVTTCVPISLWQVFAPMTF